MARDTSLQESLENILIPPPIIPLGSLPDSQSGTDNSNSQIDENSILTDLIIATINGNKTVASNFECYLKFFKERKLDILCIQEVGYIPVSNFLKNKYNISVFAQEHPKSHNYNLITVVKDSLAAYVSESAQIDQNIQILKLKSPFDLDIGNIYAQHSRETKKQTYLKLNSLVSSSKNLILLGDFNNAPIPKKDRFSSENSTTKNSDSLLTELLSSNRLTDAFRIINPNKLKFSHWVSSETSHPPKISATRIDLVLVSNNLKNKINLCNIMYDHNIPTDHHPVILSLNNYRTPPHLVSKPLPKAAHYLKWPKNLAEIFDESTSLLPSPTTPGLIESNLDAITRALNQIVDSITPKEKITKFKNKFPSQLQITRNTLLDFLSAFKRYHLNSHQFPDFLKNSAITQLQKYDENLSINFDSPTETISSCSKIVKKLSNKMNNLRRRKRSKKIQQKINDLLTHKDFDSKIIYKIIEEKQQRAEISYFLDHSKSPPKIVTDEQKVNDALRIIREKQFAKITLPKNIDKYLLNVPKISSSLTINFSPENIARIICSKNNTAPGPDSIQYSVFKFLHVHNSKVFHLLSDIYNFCHESSYIPSSWKVSTTVSIPKTNSHESLENWRPIALLNTIYKGFSLILSNHLQKTLISNGIFPEEQCGFLPNNSTTTAITTFLEILRHHNHNKLPLHALYIDVKTAFDSIQHWTIMKILSHMNLDPKTSTTIQNLLSGCTTQYKTAYGKTDPVNILTGVRQGDPLSPLLFIISLIPLQYYLRTFPQLEEFEINHLLYADDLLLLATSSKIIFQIFTATSEYFKSIDLQINAAKSAYSTTDLKDSTLR